MYSKPGIGQYIGKIRRQNQGTVVYLYTILRISQGSLPTKSEGACQSARPHEVGACSSSTNVTPQYLPSLLKRAYIRHRSLVLTKPVFMSRIRTLWFLIRENGLSKIKGKALYSLTSPSIGAAAPSSDDGVAGAFSGSDSSVSTTFPRA